MKRIFLFLVITAILLQKITAQQAINTIDLAKAVIEKGLKETDLGAYQGSLLLQAMTELAVNNKDKQALARCVAVYKKFSTKEIDGKGSFISYSAGGNGAAYISYLGIDTSLNRQVKDAAQRMFNQQKRSGEGLLTANWVADSLDPVFIDMAFAVTPYMLYAGLKEHNAKYIDPGS